MTELREQAIGEFLAALSSGNPTPGGGSAAALSGALAAALGCMVCALAGRKKEDQELSALSERLLSLREGLLDLAGEDAEAFSGVMAAYRVPKDDPGRKKAIEEALAGAADVPLRVAAACVEILDILVELTPHATPQSASDVGVAARLAGAAVDSALLNVTINLAYMKDRSRKEPFVERRDELQAEGKALAERAIKAVELRLP